MDLDALALGLLAALSLVLAVRLARVESELRQYRHRGKVTTSPEFWMRVRGPFRKSEQRKDIK